MDIADTTRLADREIIATRLLDAPRDLVWSAWTDVRHLEQWWGPFGFTTTTRRVAIEPGGEWRFVMHGPDGTDYENIITFLEVAAPTRLVYKHGGDKETHAVNFDVQVDFADEGGRTRLTMRMRFPSNAARDFVIEKYGAFVISRTFNAPLALVWKAHTEIGHLEKWWGPKGFGMIKATLDLRPGGLFHYGMRTPGGQAMWGRFAFREVIPMRRLVYVVSFSDPEGGVTRHPGSADWPLEVLNTTTFAEEGGKTTLTLRGAPVNATASERRTFKDGYKSMEGGFRGTLDQLEAYLGTAA